MDYALTSSYAASHGIDTIETKLRELMKEEGFGVLTEINVQEVMKKKLDLDKQPYRILGFCNPPRANKVLETEASMGIFLPCNGVIYEKDEQIHVALTNAYQMFAMIEHEEIEPVAKEVTEIFAKVKEQLDQEFA